MGWVLYRQGALNESLQYLRRAFNARQDPEIAAHLADVPSAFRSLRERLAPAERETVLAMGRAELDDRFNARDFRHFQVTPATGRDDLRYDIFVPLNIRWDSAALGRQRAFPSVADWLDAVLTWVGTKPGVTICIRQHPRERLDFAKGSDNLAPLLQRHAALGERLRFVAADEPLNSYDLLRHARVVLPHTSTVGIEAALLGLPVILGTRRPHVMNTSRCSIPRFPETRSRRSNSGTMQRWPTILRSVAHSCRRFSPRIRMIFGPG